MERGLRYSSLIFSPDSPARQLGWIGQKLGKVGKRKTRFGRGPEAGFHPLGIYFPPILVKLICHELVADPAHVQQAGGGVCILLDDLAQLMDVPFGEFLRFAYVGLVALRLGDEGLVIDHIWGVARQYEQIVEGSGRRVERFFIEKHAPGVQV